MRAELVASNLLLLAHSWAVKHWYFEHALDVHEFAREQLRFALYSILEPRQRRRYARYLSE